MKLKEILSDCENVTIQYEDRGEGARKCNFPPTSNGTTTYRRTWGFIGKLLFFRLLFEPTISGYYFYTCFALNDLYIPLGKKFKFSSSPTKSEAIPVVRNVGEAVSCIRDLISPPTSLVLPDTSTPEKINNNNNNKRWANDTVSMRHNVQQVLR